MSLQLRGISGVKRSIAESEKKRRRGKGGTEKDQDRGQKTKHVNMKGKNKVNKMHMKG
jgi:hypothetical protein